MNVDAATLNQIVNFLRASEDPNLQKQIEQHLNALTANPDFMMYLLYIFSNLKQESLHVRSMSGIILKNTIKQLYDKIDENYRKYLKSEILKCLNDPLPLIRRTVSSILVMIVDVTSLPQNADLIGGLLQQLDSQDPLFVEGALHSIMLFCEDFSAKFDEDPNKSLDFVIPKLLQFLRHPHSTLRRYALISLNQFIVDLPPALLIHMNAYLQGIYALTTDTDNEIRRLVCSAFQTLVQVKIDYLLPYIQDVMKFMIQATQDKDSGVAIEACEFWSAVSESGAGADLTKILPLLIPILLDRMILSDEEIAEFIEAEGSAPDKAQDIKPVFHNAKTKGRSESTNTTTTTQTQQTQPGQPQAQTQEDDDNEDDDDDDSSTDWTVRKAAAAAIDHISLPFGDSLLLIMLQLLPSRMISQNWKEREAAVLALGAVASGCDFSAQLPQIIPFLMTMFEDQSNPALRSVCLWTVVRYGDWVMDQPPQLIFQPLVIGILKRMFDTNKKVQQSACTSLSRISRISNRSMVPYLQHVVDTITVCLAQYQKNNLTAVLDALARVADAVGIELAQYLSKFMPILWQLFVNVPDDDPMLIPLLECFASLVVSVGVQLGEYIKELYTRCLRIVEKTLVTSSIVLEHGGDMPDKEIMACCLDLLSATCDGVREQIDPLVANSNLLSILFQCLKEKRIDVRQISFGLFGDLVVYIFPRVEPVLRDFMPLLLNNLFSDYVSVCNNASWALGEISMRWPGISPYIPECMQRLITIITKPNLNRPLKENIATTIGRLSVVHPTTVAPFLDQFLADWCVVLAKMPDDMEKETALKGLYNLCQLQTNIIVKHLARVVLAAVSFNEPPEPIRTNFHQYFSMIRKSLPTQQWDAEFSKSPQVRVLLAQRYGVQ